MINFELALMEWVRSCQTLKYSVVFDMYAIDVPESTLLKDLVQNLEKAVETLSETIKPVELTDETTYPEMSKVSPAYT